MCLVRTRYAEESTLPRGAVTLPDMQAHANVPRRAGPARLFKRALVQSGVMALVSLVVPQAAHADGLRCGRKLVSNGAKPYDVRSACGEPDAADRRVEFETVRRRVRVPCPGHARHAVCEVEEEYTIPHTVDTWTYDFGPRRFVHFVVFVDGTLVRVETGSYGTKDVEEEP